MFGFSKGARLDEIGGSDFVLGVGVWALRGKGTVRVVASEQGFDLQVGPATLEMLDGGSWSASPFEMSAGLAGEAVFEGRRYAIEPGAFNVLELPGERWFGLEIRLNERRPKAGPCVLSSLTLGLGITKDRRQGKALREAKWLESRRARDWREAGLIFAPEVVHQRELPTEHTAVMIAPELYGVLLDPQEGGLRFTFAREAYESLLQEWSTASIAVEDKECPVATSPALRSLSGPAANPSSLLLLPWLAPELARRSRGTPSFNSSKAVPSGSTAQTRLGRERSKRKPLDAPSRVAASHWARHSSIARGAG